jgi:hypothetical protein
MIARAAVGREHWLTGLLPRNIEEHGVDQDFTSGI